MGSNQTMGICLFVGALGTSLGLLFFTTGGQAATDYQADPQPSPKGIEPELSDALGYRRSEPGVSLAHAAEMPPTIRDSAQVAPDDDKDSQLSPSERSWMNSELWSERAGWHSAPGYPKPVEAYIGDPWFNPHALSLSPEKNQQLDDLLDEWSDLLEAKEIEQVMEAGDTILQLAQQPERLFNVGSDELQALRAQHTGGTIMLCTVANPGVVTEVLGEEATCGVGVLYPGESPHVDVAKNQLWDIALGMNDAVAQYFHELHQERVLAQ